MLIAVESAQPSATRVSKGTQSRRTRDRNGSGGAPVFYDPQHHRRWVLGTAVLLFACLILGALALGIYRLTVAPTLANIEEESAASRQNSLREFFSTPHEPPVTSAAEQGTRGTEPDRKTLPPEEWSSLARELRLAVFLPRWPARGIDQLAAHAGSVSAIMPDWYRVASTAGDVTPRDELWESQSAARIAALPGGRKDVTPVLSMAKLEGTNHFAQAIASPEGRAALAGNLVSLSNKRQLDGFCFDVADATAADRANILAFLGEFNARAKGLSTCLVIPIAADRAWLSAVAALADRVVLMAFDQRALGAQPTPPAPDPWYRASLAKACTAIDPRKIVLGVVNGGVDWTSGELRPNALTYPEAARLSGYYGRPMKFDPVSLNARFEYGDRAGLRHTVWVLDGVSAYNQLVQATRCGIRSAALYSPGAADPGFWKMIESAAVMRRNPAALEAMSLGLYVGVEGEGPLVKAVGVPRTGERSLTVDPASGLITNADIKQSPESYTLVRWGGTGGSRLVLTFDDGPDRATTGRILDVLKARKVPAVFFIVGENAQNEPDLVKRIMAEGHEIGNHFFLHGDPASISSGRLFLEVNATQRLIAGLTGRYSILMRPPYGVADPAQLEADGSIAALSRLSRMGYVAVEGDIDPQDWRRLGAASIERQIQREIAEGRGNVIVMHDAGGDRSQTISALPAVIDSLREAGYQFVSLSDFVGMPRDDLMPRAAPGEVEIDQYGFSMLRRIDEAVSGLFLLAIILALSRTTVICALLPFRRRHAPREPMPAARVTVVIPAFNEEKVIGETVHAVLQSNFEALSVIVIDNGSQDGTARVLRERFAGEPRVRVALQDNASKAAALNLGFQMAETEIVVAIDADTILLPDAIQYLAAHFADPRVAAVAGNVKVGNRDTLLARLQAMEYIVAQNLDRKAFEVLNCISVVPGAIGAWRRTAVLEAGGYPDCTVAEDADLTIALLRQGHRVVVEERAIALTEVPEDVGQFARQRFRWAYGMLQTAWRHRGALREPRLAGWIVIPNILVFQLLFQLLAPIVDLVFISVVGSLAVSLYVQQSLVIPAHLQAYLAYYALFLLADIVLAFVAFMGEPEEPKRLIWLALVQRFFYRQIMYWVAFRAILAALRGDLVGWGKLTRLARVTTPPQTS